jgi:hypothetical protein
MLSNPGHIQKIGNTPHGIAVSEKLSAVVTNGGSVFQAGLIGDRIQCTFQEVRDGQDIVGHVVDTEVTDVSTYLLSAQGSVYEYKHSSPDCTSVREVYAPVACGGDRAIRIKGGRGHVLILTEHKKVWGVGDNSQYQLVPQGQARYDVATRIIVTDTNLHDNTSCSAFTGTYTSLKTPVIPSTSTACDTSCITKSVKGELLGYINIQPATVTPPGVSGILSVPVYGDVNYFGVLCVSSCGNVSGTLNYSISRLAIRCGAFTSKFTTTDEAGCHVREFSTSSTNEIVLFQSSPCQSAATNTCATARIAPIEGTTQLHGSCGSCVVVNLALPLGFVLPTAAYDADCRTIVLQLADVRTSLTALCDTAFTDLATAHTVTIALDIDVPLDCRTARHSTGTTVELPQPCWTNIFAGGDNSVLVDDCNRLYVFGSLHRVRNNRDLLRSSCLEELLSHTNASISLPACQINCSGNRTARAADCPCNDCKDKPFKTDLSKVGIHLNLPAPSECGGMNVCQFLGQLQKCNEEISCSPTCTPCDGYVYLNIIDDQPCPAGAPAVESIGSVTVFNKRSICKLDSQGKPDLVCIAGDVSTVLEYDLNRYCIDADSLPLEKIVRIQFCSGGANVNIYVDIDQPGGIKFTANHRKYSVEFTANASNSSHEFVLNHGPVLDTLELTNLKYALSVDAFYPCPEFKNPLNSRLTLTYLRGGDHVRFVSTNPKNIRQAITADVPTVFRLGRRVLDVAVGGDNLSVLAGSLACPNEIFVIGTNCYGELGLGNNESTVCWKQLNRCQFDCQVTGLFAGGRVTFYRTQSGKIYGAGQWGCIVNSTKPCIVKSICESWRIHYIAISRTHILLLGADGRLFGVGANNIGQLGLGNTDLVRKPTCITLRKADRYDRGNDCFSPCVPCGPVVSSVSCNNNACPPRGTPFFPGGRVFPKFNRY